MKSVFRHPFFRNKNCRTGLVIILPFLIIAIMQGALTRHAPDTQNLSMTLAAPSARHLCGTDYFGRDVFARLIFGTRLTLAMAFGAAVLATLIGTLIGMIAGTTGGLIDRVLMRLTDVFLGFPRLFAILLCASIWHSSPWLTLQIIVAFSWMETARVVHAESMLVNQALYVKAAQGLGVSRFRILTAYILPNIAGVVVTSFTLLIGTVIIVESGLSFLGLGVQEPTASWGTLLNQGRQDPVGAWWLSAFAGACIVLTVTGLNLIGDGLKQLFEERRM